MGSLLNKLKEIGYKTIGVEPNKIAYQLTKKYYPNLEVLNSYFSANLINK